MSDTKRGKPKNLVSDTPALTNLWSIDFSTKVYIYMKVRHQVGRTAISADGRFEWDEDKDRINRKCHGVSFDEILSAFDDPCLLEMYYEWRKNFVP